MEIPELEFELGMAVLGGKFTTLEGLLKDIRELVSPLSTVDGRFSSVAWGVTVEGGVARRPHTSWFLELLTGGFFALKQILRDLNISLECEDKVMGILNGDSQASLWDHVAILWFGVGHSFQCKMRGGGSFQHLKLPNMYRHVC